MSKKGFTLIELIGVIAILGVLAVFGIPALTKTLKKSADKEYDEFVKNITLAAENYFHSETNGIIDTNSKKFIKVQTLKDAGYLKNSVNPLTNTNVSNDATVIITKNIDGIEKYDFVDKDVTTSGYVQNGLIMHYDGYTAPVNGEWPDLTNNHNNGSLTNVTWNNSFYNFNGTSLVSYTPSTTRPATYSFTIKAPYTTNMSVVFGDPNSNAGFGFYPYNNQVVAIVKSSTGSEAMFDLTDFPYDGIASIQIVYTSSSTKLFVNGKQYSTISASNNWDWETNYTTIGGRISGGSQNIMFDGNIYDFIVYNRALSDDEAKQNYEVDKYRFGAGE